MYVDAIKRIADGTVLPKKLSVDDFDFRLDELLKNNSQLTMTNPSSYAAVWVSDRTDFGRSLERPGGGCRDRTDDPLLAKQVLSQLS